MATKKLRLCQQTLASGFTTAKDAVLCLSPRRVIAACTAPMALLPVRRSKKAVLAADSQNGKSASTLVILWRKGSSVRRSDLVCYEPFLATLSKQDLAFSDTQNGATLPLILKLQSHLEYQIDG